jgi:hypothetical protein
MARRWGRDHRTRGSSVHTRSPPNATDVTFSRLSQEILQQLTALDGVDLEATIQIQAHRAAGLPVDKVRVVLENARTLKFDQFGFESKRPRSFQGMRH